MDSRNINKDSRLKDKDKDMEVVLNASLRIKILKGLASLTDSTAFMVNMCGACYPFQHGATSDECRQARVDQSGVVGGWNAVDTSKRGYNDVVDMCIAYNCPHVIPGSLDFMRCVRQFHCM